MNEREGGRQGSRAARWRRWQHGGGGGRERAILSPSRTPGSRLRRPRLRLLILRGLSRRVLGPQEIRHESGPYRSHQVPDIMLQPEAL